MIDIKALRPALTIDEAAFAAAQIDFTQTKEIQKHYQAAKSSKYNLKSLEKSDWVNEFAVELDENGEPAKYIIPDKVVFQAVAEMAIEPNMRTIQGVKEALMMEIKASYYHQRPTELEIYNLYILSSKRIDFKKTTISKESLYVWFKNKGYEISDLRPFNLNTTSALPETKHNNLQANETTNTRERDNLLKMLALATKALAGSKGSTYGSEEKPNKSQIADLLRGLTDDHTGLSVKNITDKISEGLKLL